MTCHHDHICACGAELRCKVEPDKCAAGHNWQCPTCEQASFDIWISAAERMSLENRTRTITAPEQEKDR